MANTDTAAPPVTAITYPMRPINGGPWLTPSGTPAASRFKRDGWMYQPKYNGWRALVHIPTGTMFNRKGQRLSIEGEFKDALAQMRATLDAEGFKWADCEALERRHNIGQGCLIVLDVVPENKYADAPAIDRWGWLEAVLDKLPMDDLPSSFPLLSVPPWVDENHVDEMWGALQAMNRFLGVEFYEGVVGKRQDSRYHRQLRFPDEANMNWIKHRWTF